MLEVEIRPDLRSKSAQWFLISQLLYQKDCIQRLKNNSDHSPCTEDLKLVESGDFMSAWGGVSSVQFGLPLFWTEGKKRGFEIKVKT
jgi:dihydroorotase-like cyclic amidohydrolase